MSRAWRESGVGMDCWVLGWFDGHLVELARSVCGAMMMAGFCEHVDDLKRVCDLKEPEY